MYAILTALISLVQVLMAVPVRTYFATFLGLSGFLLLTILLSETANSLVNPVEGMVLAHYPIDGATYTAAKLTHLLRVLAYTVPALNLLPALAGVLLPQAAWWYPLVHFVVRLAARHDDRAVLLRILRLADPPVPARAAQDGRPDCRNRAPDSHAFRGNLSRVLRALDVQDQRACWCRSPACCVCSPSLAAWPRCWRDLRIARALRRLSGARRRHRAWARRKRRSAHAPHSAGRRHRATGRRARGRDKRRAPGSNMSAA